MKKGFEKYENMSTCKHEVIKQLLAEDNEQENSGTFWWITKDIAFHSNKIFFYKKTGNIKLFPVNLHNDYCHSFNDTDNSGSLVPCETSKPNMVGQMFGSQLEADLTLQNGPGKWFSRTSNGFRTMSLLGGGIV